MFTDEIIKFGDKRYWTSHYNPRTLVLALSGEIGELVEHFLWTRDDEHFRVATDTLYQVAYELADVAMCLMNLADKCGVDIRICKQPYFCFYSGHEKPGRS